jgi:1,4-alpha-glucan branching enzyme
LSPWITPDPGTKETRVVVKKRFFKTKDECEVEFVLATAQAREVALVCEANGWEPIEMKKNRKGTFRTRLRLPKEQQFQFRYLVDGEAWINDETADAYRPNQFGGENGILDTTPTG